MAGALAELKQIQIELQRDYPDVYSQAFINRTGFAMNVTTLRDSVVGGTIVRAIWLLFAAVGLVLLIAAANVANLFLVRIDARRREVAVRTALGADRAHLAVHYLTESVLLALIAAAGAIAIAWALLHVVLAIAPQSLPRLDEVSLDWRGSRSASPRRSRSGSCSGCCRLAGRMLDVALLREGGRGLTSSRARDVARRGLVLSQVALAVVLLSSAALMAKTLRAPSQRQAGVRSGRRDVDVDHGARERDIANAADVVGFWRDLTQRVEAIPGVVHAGASGTLPLANAGGCSGVHRRRRRDRERNAATACR